MKVPTKADFQFFFQSDRAILLACIGIALIFWLLVKLSQDFKTSGNFEIRYSLPSGKTFTSTPPNEVKATLSGKGWDLISNRFKSKNNLLLFELSETPTQNIGSSLIIDKIQQLVSGDVEVSDVNVDYIFIEIENQAEKKVPVALKKKLSFAPLFHLIDSLVVDPDSVLLSGPLREVESVTSWPTEILELSDIRTSSTQKVSLAPPLNDQIRLNVSEVSVTLTVEQFTEESLFVPISIKNGPDSLKLFPEKLRLSYVAGLSKIKEIDRNSFTVEVDLTGIPLNTEKNTIPVYIARQPDFVKGVKLNPQSVEFFFVEAQDSTGKAAQ